jgi:hypothetical protein
MATYTLRPNADWNNASLFTISGGSASVHAALADNSDSTYVSKTSSSVPANYEAEFGTQTLTANEIVTSVNVRARFTMGGTGSITQFSLGVITDRNGRTVSYSVPISRQGTQGTITTIDMALNLTSSPTGAPWTQTAIDNLVVKFADNSIVVGDKANLYELYIDVLTSTKPTVVVTAPTGTVTDTSFPSIVWTYTDAEGDLQSAYQIRIFDSSVYSGGSFNPDTSTPVLDTGIVASTNNGATLVLDLADATTYRAYVRVAHLVNGSNFFSNWAFSQFTIDVDAPATPTLSAFYDAEVGAVTVTIFGRTNVLSANQASLELDTTGWVAAGNSSIARSTAQASNGVASLAITATASGDALASTTTATSFSVEQAYDFSAIADFRAFSTARSCAVGIRFLNASGATISTIYSTPVTNSSTGWTTGSVTATAPATSDTAQVFVRVISAGASEVHYVDKIAFHAGKTPVWTRGGFSDFAFDVERSNNGGFDTLRGSPVSANGSQIAEINDFEAPLDATIRYRAKARANI